MPTTPAMVARTHKVAAVTAAALRVLDLALVL
jgi:hypothetical protein